MDSKAAKQSDWMTNVLSQINHHSDWAHQFLTGFMYGFHPQSVDDLKSQRNYLEAWVWGWNLGAKSGSFDPSLTLYQDGLVIGQRRRLEAVAPSS